MPKRALAEKRPWLLASLAAGISYFFVMKSPEIPGLWLLAWKGAGGALLAAYALARHKGQDSRMIAGVMTLGALGDVTLELNLFVGAGFFLLGHLLAIALYLRHRREVLTASQRLAALALLLATPLVAWLLPADRTQALPVGLYALALGGMACAAWSSSFPRYRVGIGAVMFVASDLLIFARMGSLASSPLPDLLIWPLYYFGQFLICTGVVGELRRKSA